MDFLDKYFKYENNIEISGLTLELNIFYLLYLFKKCNKNLLVVSSSLYEATKINNLISTYSNNNYLFPMDDFFSSMIVATSPELKYTRLETLDKIKNNKSIVCTNLMGLLKFLPKYSNNNDIIISKNDSIKRDELIGFLVNLGYKKDSLVTATGEYAVRGFIVDVFLMNEKKPIRIEFDGNEVESIRYFNIETQLSSDEVCNVTLKPIDEIINNEYSSIIDFLDNPIVIFINKNQIDVSYKRLVDDIFEYQKELEIKESLMYKLEDLKLEEIVNLNTIDNNRGNFYISSELINYKENFDLLLNDYNKWLLNKKEIYFCLDKENEIKIINNLIPNAKIIKMKINKGFIFENFVVIGENDIEEIKDKPVKYKKNYYIGKRIKDYNQLEIGDYVVHISHGIAQYNGIKTLNVRSVKKDFLELLYSGNDKIYVPVEKISNIYKYSDKDSEQPKLSNLNSGLWEKTKKYVEKKIEDISRELIELYKKRISIKKIPYKSYEEELMFSKEFEFEETKDQSKSIGEINKDLVSDYPMDRLLCGDVGFGKTEVALRAIFKTVLNNYQVMYLCPTTILSNQQYNVMKNRFKDWPINVRLLNRFVTKKESDKILKEASNGNLDILVGTHRLLSDDVFMKNLGLLVVDEEQRFGVKHKEKIKSLKQDVNVLTLSATPIPRTLKMAMSGLRDLSIIDTPPVNRFPVQTYVIKEDELVVKDAIYKELSRGGQIYILYNKVESIEDFTLKIRKLVPDAKIEFAHGQMAKNELESIMNDFINNQFDILVCTTIIESGIDISNVNTLIVYDADHFGLSQLYQIRGRVGRSNKIGYAYLLYKPNKILSEISIKRLNTIKDFTELGSGYKIAMRDLSLRGAGDIFGSSQAGFVDAVGVSLYMKMIEDEMKRIKGEEVIEEDDEAKSLLNVSTYIDNEYVSDEEIKIEIHQKINQIDSFASLVEVKNELEDRFGPVSEDLEIYMYQEWFEKIAKKHNISKVIQTDRYVEITLPENISQEIKGDKLLLEAFSISNSFFIKYVNNCIKITLYFKNLEKHFIYYLVELLDKTL